jgi:hypothetical protein
MRRPAAFITRLELSMNTSLAHLYTLLGRVAAIECEMQNGMWSFNLVGARDDAIRCLVKACEDQISMPAKRRARSNTLPYLDLTTADQREIANVG